LRYRPLLIPSGHRWLSVHRILPWLPLLSPSLSFCVSVYLLLSPFNLPSSVRLRLNLRLNYHLPLLPAAILHLRHLSRPLWHRISTPATITISGLAPTVLFPAATSTVPVTATMTAAAFALALTKHTQRHST